MHIPQKVKYLKYLGTVILIVSVALFSNAQDIELDSLKSVVKSMDEDTLKVNMLNEISGTIASADPEAGILYGEEAKILAESLNFQRGLALAYKNMGLGYYFQGNYSEALKNWEPSLEIYQTLGDDRLSANILSNVGAIFSTGGTDDKAVEYYLRALELAEKVQDSVRIGTLNLNIGLIYSKQPFKLDSAVNYYLRAINMGESIGYMDLMGVGCINLGEVYFKMQENDSALHYFEKSILILSGGRYISGSLNYMGQIYANKGEFRTAIKFQEDALEMAREGNDPLEITKVLLGLASTYSKQDNHQFAINYYDEARVMAMDKGLNTQLSEAYHGLAYSYGAIEEYALAYSYLSLQDTIDNAIYRLKSEDNTSALMFDYQLKKKDDVIQVLEHEKQIEKLKSRRQRIMIIAIGLLGALIFIVSVGLYNRMQFIRKTNQKINAQKDEISSQRDEIQDQRDHIQEQHDTVFAQKEMITDSISYAQRIQSAMLPSTEELEVMMPDHFIFFRPKDIVSGDFYWINEVQDHLIIVGADCTGHGVPGAFMSMLGITLLNALVGERCFDAPSAMLEQLRLKIKELLDQEGKDDEQKDGMDMVIAIINKNTRELHFAGANNPLYIVRPKNGQDIKALEPYANMDNEEYQLFELKGDRQPIGTYWEETPFTTHSVMLDENDSLYMFSDGFVDQYGGEKRKKFKSMNFKKLLLSIQNQDMVQQEVTLADTFENWRGEIEQIDDVSVIGVRI